MQGVGHTLYIAMIYFWTPETLLSISLQHRKNLQLQVQWHYFTSLGWPGVQRTQRGSHQFGVQECALKRRFCLFCFLTQM